MCTPRLTFARRAARIIRFCTICRVNGVPIVLAEHPLAPQVPMLGERRGEPSRERHVAQPSTLRRSHLAVPVRPLDAQLPLREIDVAPLERDHLAAPQPRLTAQQHDAGTSR